MGNDKREATGEEAAPDVQAGAATLSRGVDASSNGELDPSSNDRWPA